MALPFQRQQDPTGAPRLQSRGHFLPAAADEELLERRKAALAAHFRAAIDESLEEVEAAE
jgi:hypothetical protein